MTRRDFDASVVHDVSERPWPLPTSPWLMTQTWHDLLFMHWRVDRAGLRAAVPAAFELDLFEGQAWVAVVPFYMANVGPRGLPALPGISEFPELNVRTYVRVDDRPGVCFFSLDAGSAFAVRAARLLLNLPYYTAEMTMARHSDGIHVESRRHGAGAIFEARYRPVGAPSAPQPGTLEYFLTERYCLYQVDRRGRPYRLEIHHRRWLLQSATAEIAVNTVAAVGGIMLPPVAPLLHFSKRQDVVAWAPSPL